MIKSTKMKLISEKYKNFLFNRIAETTGIIFFGLAILTFGLLFSYSPLDPSLNNITSQEAQNIFGNTGASVADLLVQIFGSLSYVLLLFLLTWSYKLIVFKKLPFFAINFFAGVISLLILNLIFLTYEINIYYSFISSELYFNFIEPLAIRENLYSDCLLYTSPSPRD